MNDPIFYAVTELNSYAIEIDRVTDITQAPDDFMTKEEMVDEYGLDENATYYSRIIVFESKLTEEIAMWAEKLRQSGKRSIEVTDEELIETLTTHTFSPLSHYHEGLLRKGNRFVLAAPKEKKVGPTKKHASMLVSTITSQLWRKYRVDVTFKYIYDSYEASINAAKALIGSWEQIDWSVYQYSQEDIAMVKQVWDNPAMFNKPVDQTA